ncbi:MAG TPA: hypothetical protein VIJ78_13205 [Pseudolabrys sp.]|nr:hypothetical protein [Pseudolabrys sp.]
MRVEATKQASFQQQTGGFLPDGDASNEREQSRELVVTAPAQPAEVAGRPRQATFLAHLIATKEKAPQTRERRRAEPSEAIAAYRAVQAITRA